MPHSNYVFISGPVLRFVPTGIQLQAALRTFFFHILMKFHSIDDFHPRLRSCHLTSQVQETGFLANDNAMLPRVNFSPDSFKRSLSPNMLLGSNDLNLCFISLHINPFHNWTSQFTIKSHCFRPIFTIRTYFYVFVVWSHCGPKPVQLHCLDNQNCPFAMRLSI